MVHDAYKQLRVGLGGYGFAPQTFHAPLVQAVREHPLVGIAFTNTAKVHADFPTIKVHKDLETMISNDKLDLVIVASPNETHAPLCDRALRADVHVVADKPFALNMKEARELIRVSERVNRRLWVFHNRRWDSDYLTIKAAIREGIVGKVAHFESRIDRFRPVVRDRWRERAQLGGGIWFDIGPHLIDQALQILGFPDSVVASLASQRDAALVDDWAHVVLIYGERRVVLQASMLVAGGSPRFVVHGTGAASSKINPISERVSYLPVYARAMLVGGRTLTTSLFTFPKDTYLFLQPPATRAVSTNLSQTLYTAQGTIQFEQLRLSP